MDKTMKTPLEDLRKQALEHYEEAATAIVHYNSFVRDAIMAYDPEQKLLQHSVMQAEGSDEHICKYCGVLTSQPDEDCYKNPNRAFEFKSRRAGN